jgi:hypothetical protein
MADRSDGYTDGGTIVPQWWINQVERGKAFRRDYAHEERWNDWRRWYRGQWRKGILPSNVYFKMLRTLIPRVYYRNPSVSITPTKPGIEYMLLAKLLERADNKLLDVMGVKEQMKRAVQLTTMFGTSAMRLGYGAEFTPTPDALSTEGPDTGGRRVARRVEYNDLVHPNAPWCLAAHPGQLVVPANTVDIHSARWVCYEVTRPWDDIRDDPRFENTKELQDGMRGSGQPGQLLARGDSRWERMREGVVLWEIRDKKSGLVFVIAPYSNATPPDKKVLFRGEDDMQIRGRLPCYPLIFNTDDEVFWGVPDSMILEPQQVEKNEIRTQIMYHRRAALWKMLYEKGSVSPDEISKLTSDDNVNVAVQVNNINAVREITVPSLPDTLLESEELVDREVQELLGMGVNQFGEYAPGSADRSATEANIVNQATMIRIDERRDTCADLLTMMVSDMNHVIAERWDQDMILDIIGPAGIPIWVQFQPSLLRDLQYDIKVDPDTSLPLTKQLREQKATALYQLLGQDPLINPVALREFFLNELYGVEADHLLMNPQQPGATVQNPTNLDGAANLFRQQAQSGGVRPPVQRVT